MPACVAADHFCGRSIDACNDRRAAPSLPPLLAVVAGGAHAEVKQAAADSFVLTYSSTLDVAPDKVYAVDTRRRALVERRAHLFGRRRQPEHESRGRARAFASAGRTTPSQHGTVLMAIRDQALRIGGAFGPLQGMGVNAVLSIGTRAEAGGTALTMVYRVNGTSGNALDKLAPDVDQVLAEQFRRLVNVATTGKAVAP